MRQRTSIIPSIRAAVLASGFALGIGAISGSAFATDQVDEMGELVLEGEQ